MNGTVLVSGEELQKIMLKIFMLIVPLMWLAVNVGIYININLYFWVPISLLICTGISQQIVKNFLHKEI
jgi:hypothetical protein